MVCYLMEKLTCAQRRKWDSKKQSAWCFLERHLCFFKRNTYQLWKYMHTINPIFFLVKIKLQRTEILLSNLETLKQLETMRKYWSLNFIMKSCLNTLKILGHFQLKYTVPGSSPIQTIWRWVKNNCNTLSLILLWWIKAKCSNNTRSHVSFGSVFDGKTKCTYWRRHHLW